VNENNLVQGSNDSTGKFADFFDEIAAISLL